MSDWARVRVETRLKGGATELLQVAAAFGLLEAALWSTGFMQVFWGLALLAFAGIALAATESNARDLGLLPAGTRRALWIIPTALAIGGSILFLGGMAGTLHRLGGHNGAWWRALLYALWSVVQQFLLQSFIFTRLEAVLERRTAVLASALLFAVAHLPNPALVPLTLLAGLVLTELFWRYRNIYVLGVAHAIMGLCIAAAFPDQLTHAMHVGIAYYFR